MVIDVLKKHFARHGIPNILVSDNGPQYSSAEFQQFASQWEFQHVTSSPKHQQSNGKAESAVKICKSMLKKAQMAKNDVYLRSIDDKWSQFKKAVTNTMLKNIPQREIKSRKYLPWLNQDIKFKMKVYDKAKKTQLPKDWNAYRLTRNTINVLLDTAHKNYCANLFMESFNNNKKQFWSYIKRTRKEHSGISILVVNGKATSCAKDKAKILNNQFQSVFSKEDLSNIPKMNSTEIPQMPNISFSTRGIQLHLESLVPGKAPGPDGLPTYISKHCSSKIAPILQVQFTQSLSTGTLPRDWLTANITPVYKKGS